MTHDAHEDPPTGDPGPLVRRLLGSSRLGTPPSRLILPAVLAHHASCLYGRRGVYRPAMALRTIQRLGPSRHAVAQRTVAGILEIHAPFAPKPSGADKDRRTDAGRVAAARASAPPGAAPRRG